MLKGKKIILGVTGSIAAYKSILLVRALVKEGAEVRVIMTPSARDFVTPLSLSTLSRQPVLTDLFEGDAWANHVMLGRWADCMVVAPLSCNSLSKMAYGVCDNLLMAVWLSATCPVLLAPAMDEDMWRHPATRGNLEKLKSFGAQILPVESGELASGLVGEGRMAEPETIMEHIRQHFSRQGDLKGKKALVTAGPTHEAIDPVRFISNYSSGKMGVSLARELAIRGAGVCLVLGPTSLEVEIPGAEIVRVKTAEEMFAVCVGKFPEMDIGVMAAAVADYRPTETASDKIKKTGDYMVLELTRTKDILLRLGEMRRNGQVLVGFALESNNEKAYALQKLKEKHADMIVLNSLNDPEAGFGVDTNKITIFQKDGQELSFGQKSKQQVAADIVDRIVKLLYA